MTMGVDIGELVYKMVCGLHGEHNSERAADPTGKHDDYVRVGVPTKALYIPFDIRASYRKDKMEGEASCSLHYLFCRLHGNPGFCTTYTFAAADASPFAKLHDITQWEFLSAHDSCWRDAARDRAWRIEQYLYEEVMFRAGLRDEDAKVPYRELNWHVSFPLFNKRFFDWVDVQIDRDLEDKHGYEKLITVIKEKKHEQAKSRSA